MRIRFISSTPMNVFQGSGTYVGIEALARSIRDLGVQVDMVTPRFQFPVLTAQRLLFNQTLRFRPRKNYDVTVGFDMDGYTIAGHSSAGGMWGATSTSPTQVNGSKPATREPQ